MAQLVERILGKDEVPSSTLGISTMKTKASLEREAFLRLQSDKHRYLPSSQLFWTLRRYSLADHGHHFRTKLKILLSPVCLSL